MPNITLTDGKKLNFEKSVTGSEVAEKISKSLAKQASKLDLYLIILIILFLLFRLYFFRTVFV